MTIHPIDRALSALSGLSGLFALCGLWLCASPAAAAGPEDARGLWLTADKDAVIEFKPCADAAGALCGHVVWDKDAGTPTDTCGLQVAQYGRFDDQAWRDGWAYDPRDRKTFKSVVRVKGDVLHLRAFVGTELLGQTERLSRVTATPASPRCGKPSH